MNEPRVSTDRAEVASEFVQRLKELKERDRGGMAILRRNAGETLSTSRGAAAVFYRLLPPGVAQVQEEVFFLVATLYALNDRTHTGNFGQTMRDVKERSGRDSIDLRMKVLLDSTFDRIQGGGELAYRLRQAVKLAASKDVGVNWPQLIADLSWWAGEQRRVQKAWARSYYRQTRAATDVETAEGGTSDAH